MVVKYIIYPSIHQSTCAYPTHQHIHILENGYFLCYYCYYCYYHYHKYFKNVYCYFVCNTKILKFYALDIGKMVNFADRKRRLG